jgi:hypothetical protein
VPGRECLAADQKRREAACQGQFEGVSRCHRYLLCWKRFVPIITRRCRNSRRNYSSLAAISARDAADGGIALSGHGLEKRLDFAFSGRSSKKEIFNAV